MQKTMKQEESRKASFAVLHVELDVLEAVELVHAQPVRRANLRRQRLQRAEAHRLDAPAAFHQPELEVPLADDALVFDGECIAEDRLRKALAPDPAVEQARDLEREMHRIERAVGFHYAQTGARRQELVDRELELG